MPERSLGCSRYIATFLDDYSKFSVVIPAASKADVPDIVKRTMKPLETKSGQQLKAVRTGNHRVSQHGQRHPSTAST
jgi:hypothetical protein